MDDTNPTALFSAPTEISLQKDATFDMGSTNTNGNHMNGDEPPKFTDYPSSAPDGAKSFAGSTSVGSRLAGDDTTGTRLASSASYDAKNGVNNSNLVSGNSGFSSKSSLGSNNSSRPEINRKLTDISIQEVQKVASDKAELMKTWSVKAYKCTKQMLSEKLGKSSRTVDLELEAKIDILKDTKLKYENLLMLTRALINHFMSVVQTQKVLGSVFDELATKSQDLQEEFKYNGETQLVLAQNGENLIQAITFFVSSLNTLCTKTIEDTLLTISKYESARLTYDAYKNELEAINLLPRTEANILKQANAQASYNTYKLAYEKVRDDVDIKLQFLNENRIKVMQKNLLLFHNAISAYFAGNQQQLEATMKQFNIRSSDVNVTSMSWLERE